MAKVAFIGLGVMGYPMAGHLTAGGHDVTVYNRTAAKAKKWVKKYGGKSARTPREAVKNKEFVFICVGNDDDLQSVVLGDKGALAGMSKGSILIDNTTASANVARELHATARKVGVGFIDAPVSGGQAGAENGVLTVNGKKESAKEPKNFLHQGIANRSFERKFNLADHIEVVDAELVNGLLTISLVKEVPEAMKPKKIAIGSSSAKVIQHKNGEAA